MNFNKHTLLFSLVLVLGWGSFFSILKADQGAWSIQHDWHDKMEDGTTFAENYAIFAEKRVKELYKDRVKLDCADLAITIFVEYAHKHGLEVQFNFPSLRKRVSSKDKQFNGMSFPSVLRWFREQVGATNLADNTYAIPIKNSRAGDVFLFDWNQTPTYPNFPGRVVWHTYLVGNQGAKEVYYGNMGENNEPFAVELSGRSIQNKIRTHPDRYGSGARRFILLKVPPKMPTSDEIKNVSKEGQISARTLNIRKGPSTDFGILEEYAKDTWVSITGKFDDWYRILMGNDDNKKEGWAHGNYVKEGTKPKNASGTTSPPVTGLLEKLEEAKKTEDSKKD